VVFALPRFAGVQPVLWLLVLQGLWMQPKGVVMETTLTFTTRDENLKEYISFLIKNSSSTIPSVYRECQAAVFLLDDITRAVTQLDDSDWLEDTVRSFKA
jgi:hypothetical protein